MLLLLISCMVILTFQFKETLYTTQSYRAQGTFHVIEGQHMFTYFAKQRFLLASPGIYNHFSP